MTFEKTFIITATNVDEAPTDLALSSNTILENQPSGTLIGSFSSIDLDIGDNFTYSLVSGAGAEDNSAFQIVGGELRSNAAFNFEAKFSYSIRVRSTDTESTDNALFRIVGNELQTAAVLDFEARSSYSIRVSTTDAGGLTFEKVFTVTASDINEVPTDIVLSSDTVAENQQTGAVVGTFTTTDPDGGDAFSYGKNSSRYSHRWKERPATINFIHRRCGSRVGATCRT